MIFESQIQNYTQRQLIGSGAYGSVYKCKDTQTKEIVAVKQVSIDMSVEGLPSSLIREISVLQEAYHPNIVALKHVFYDEKNAYLVFEYLEESLRKKIQSNKKIGQKQIKQYLYSIIAGIAHCHKKYFFHRDLKPQNILINSQGKLKIADFGLARTYFVPDRIYTEEVVTLWYRAPELILRQSYSTPVDVWSIGCIFAEMLAMKNFFRGNSELQQMDLYLKAFGTPKEKIWPNINMEMFAKYQRKTIQEILENQQIDQNAADLLEVIVTMIQRMFEFDPKKRITAADALKHPYFKDLSH